MSDNISPVRSVTKGGAAAAVAQVVVAASNITRGAKDRCAPARALLPVAAWRAALPCSPGWRPSARLSGPRALRPPAHPRPTQVPIGRG